MEVEEIVRAIAAHLGNRALFIGGVAVEAYVAYRRTHDVDVVIRARDLHQLRDLLDGEGFRYRASPHLEKHIFKAPDRGEVDAYTSRVGEVEVTESLFERGRTLPYAGTRIRVAGFEDLLSLKLAAAREMDLVDAAVLLWEKGDEVDTGLLEALVGRETLRELAGDIAEALPLEYGWVARQRLKERVRQRGWMD